ncbi:TniQ family protein [Mycolicibacterium sp. XJ870]
MGAARADNRVIPALPVRASSSRRATPSVSRIDRSFPLRVAPIQGEALDSWLDAIAHRHHVPRRAVIERCAIAPLSFYGAWIRLLTPADIDGIAQATGYGRHVVDALALPRSGSGVGPLSGARTLPSSTWDWRTSSRWCPQCLTDSGGRWDRPSSSLDAGAKSQCYSPLGHTGASTQVTDCAIKAAISTRSCEGE